MRVIIPYKAVLNNDLEYAVASIIKNYRPLEDIIIVGDAPRFKFDGQVIPCADTGKKEFNIYSKLKMVEGTYLFTNDDIFFLNPVTDVPNYYKGTCGEYRGGPYYSKMYSLCPPYWLDFDVHCPMVIDSGRLNWLGHMPLKSQYGNSLGLEGTFTPDFKAKTLSEVDLSRDFLSITEGLSKSIEPLLKELFS